MWSQHGTFCGAGRTRLHHRRTRGRHPMSVHPMPPGGRRRPPSPSPAGFPTTAPIPGTSSAAAASPGPLDGRDPRSVPSRPVRTDDDSRRDTTTPCGPVPRRGFADVLLARFGLCRLSDVDADGCRAVCTFVLPPFEKVACRTEGGRRSRIDIQVSARGIAVVPTRPGPWVLSPLQVGRLRGALRAAVLRHAELDNARREPDEGGRHALARGA